MTAHYPVSLYLEPDNDAQVGEHGIFRWWLHNEGDEVIGGVTLQVEPSAKTHAIELSIGEPNEQPLGPGEYRRQASHFVVRQAGEQSLKVRLTLQTASGRHELITRQETSFIFSRPVLSGPVHIETQGPVYMKGPFASGTYKLAGPVIMAGGEPGGLFEKPPSMRIRRDQDMPPKCDLMHFDLEPVRVPGLYPVDLKAFADGWIASGRGRMRELAFIDRQGATRPGTVVEGDVYRLRLASFQGGFITMIVRGSGGQFMQLVPHCHEGAQVIPSHQELQFPRDLLRAVMSADGIRDEICEDMPFSGVGNEEALVVISQAHLADPAWVFVQDNAPPAPLAQEIAREILTKALEQRQVELGYARVKVVARANR